MTSQPATPRPVSLTRDPWGQLIMDTNNGRRFSAVVPVRAFPVSDPDHWISICDAQGAEILCVEDIRALPPEVRMTLQRELAQREFVPVIRKILSATHHEPSDWVVETDRGQTTFQVNSEDDVRRIEPDMASIVDAHGVRYLIANVKDLDHGSRRNLEYFL